MPKRLVVILIRSLFYSALMAAHLWKLYSLSKMVEDGIISKSESIAAVATMTGSLLFVALLTWLFTWKYQQAHGILVATLIAGLLTGVGAAVFIFFVIGAIRPLASTVDVFFRGEARLVFWFLVIPVAAVISATSVAFSGALVRSKIA